MNESATIREAGSVPVADKPSTCSHDRMMKALIFSLSLAPMRIEIQRNVLKCATIRKSVQMGASLAPGLTITNAAVTEEQQPGCVEPTRLY
jgi:hypothetical protein